MSYWEVGNMGWWEPLEWGLTSADKNLNGNQVPKGQVETAAPGGKGDGFTLARSTPDAVRVMGSRAGFGSPAGNEGNMRWKVTEITLAHMNSGPEEKERKRWGASIRQSKERAESTVHGECFVKTREVGRWEKMPGKGKEQREGKRSKVWSTESRNRKDWIKEKGWRKKELGRKKRVGGINPHWWAGLWLKMQLDTPNTRQRGIRISPRTMRGLGNMGEERKMSLRWGRVWEGILSRAELRNNC